MAKLRPDGPWPQYARELGASIQRHRISRRLTQEQVAYAAGLTRYTFQKFEKDESMPQTPANPSLRNIMTIAQVLEVSLDELIPRQWPDLRAGLPVARFTDEA
jgi:transcriptional regulator with XRE-family HTH domain